MKTRAFARRALGASYPLSKRYAQWSMRGATDRRIIVFTMGKTGSTALARALAQASGERVYQVFRLNAAGVAGAEERFRVQLHERTSVGTRTFPFPGSMHLWESDFLVNHQPSPRTRWDVVTSVRDPVGQAVSAFFHAQSREQQQHIDEPSLEGLRERLLAEGWLQRPMQWFDREFVGGLGIDAFLQPFDPSIGTTKIERDSLRVLLVRQEKLSDTTETLREFLELSQPINIVRRNAARERRNGSTYEEFLDRIRLPVDAVDETYSSQLSRHFYSDVELAHLRSRWTGTDSTATRAFHESEAARDASRA